MHLSCMPKAFSSNNEYLSSWCQTHAGILGRPKPRSLPRLKLGQSSVHAQDSLVQAGTVVSIGVSDIGTTCDACGLCLDARQMEQQCISLVHTHFKRAISTICQSPCQLLAHFCVVHCLLSHLLMVYLLCSLAISLSVCGDSVCCTSLYVWGEGTYVLPWTGRPQMPSGPFTVFPPNRVSCGHEDGWL